MLLVDRVKYFRERSSRDRAREERDILVEEFKRTIRYYTVYQNAWLLQAAKQSSLGGCAYAHKQAAMFKHLSDQCTRYQDRALEKGSIFDKWYIYFHHIL